MEPASAEGGGSDSGRALRRYGPIAAIVVVALVIAGLVIVNSGDDGDDAADTSVAATEAPPASETTETEPAATEPADTEPADTEPTDSEPADTEPADTDPVETEPPPVSPLPDGVMSFTVAEELGIADDIDWGERCDTEAGRVAVPDFFAPDCYQPFDGDNGGETARGVTGDTIRIVRWIDQDEDPVLAFLTSAIANDDTNAQIEDTLRGMIEYWETYYETYGRNVELIMVEGSGITSDAAAARADAVKIDEELDPFLVWGGPLLTGAFAEELGARGIPCISCGPSQQPDYYDDTGQNQFTVGKSGPQLNQIIAEYVSKRLAGDPAIHAGDESMHDTTRVFGRIWIESSAASADANKEFEEALGAEGVEITESQSYALDPATLQESAATVIARMKEAGVTSVIFSGDPIAPREFTNEATAQNYFPEWIVTGSVLVDTTAFSRTYDQDQWAHAFGISNLSARVDREVASSYALYEWFHGEPPAADETIGVITPAPQTFYSALQEVGPALTIENFTAAMLTGEPTVRAVTAPSISYGEQGRWPGRFEPDHHGVDDVTEIWWDRSVEGLDEIDKEGVGMWRYVDGGARYLPGEILEGPPKAFVEEGTVTVYAERPADESPPRDYEPLSAS